LHIQFNRLRLFEPCYICNMDVLRSLIPFEDILKSYGKNIFLSVITISFVLLIRFLLVRTIFSKGSPGKEFSWTKKGYYITSIIMVIMIFLIWLPHLTAFFTLFSIFGTGLVVVLKDVILNIAGWFYLVFRRPFEIGNRIMIMDFSGDVIDIRLLEFSMIEVTPVSGGGQSTGRIIRVPNALLFQNPLVNSSKDFALSWNEIKVRLSLKSNWKKAAALLESLAKENLEHIYNSDERLLHAEKKHLIKYNKIDPKVYIDYEGESIQLVLRHLSEPRKMRDIKDLLWRLILERFSKEKDIHLL